MKKSLSTKLLSLLLSVAVLCSVSGLSVYAQEEEKTVTVSVNGIFSEHNHWENATYTYTVSENGVSDHGILSNGNYSFLYFPATGEIKNTERTTSFAYVNGMNDQSCPDIVIPVSIEAFSAGDTAYPAKTISLYAQSTDYAIFRYDASIANARIIIPEGVESLPNNVFGQMEKTNRGTTVVLPSTLKSIGQNTFAMSSGGGMYHEFILPEGLETLGPSCFQNCRFEKIELPKNVTVINNNLLAFMKSNLKEVVFHGEITSIGSGAFAEDNSLEKITFHGKTAPAVNSNAFQKAALYGVLTVFYPANGIGYTDQAFTNAFPSGTVFKALPGNPVASNVVILGKNVVGETLTASYSYSDPSNRPENGSIGTWSRADDAAFTKNVQTIKTEAVSAGVPSACTLTESENGKYIRFSVIPKNAGISLNTGDAAGTVFSEPIRMPQTKPVVTLLAPSDGVRAIQNEPLTLKARASCDSTVITTVEFYADQKKIAQCDSAPYETQWTPTQPGTVTITAKATNALSESTISQGAVINILEPGQHTDPVWAKKWAYDFSEFTDTTEHTGTITLPGMQPPTVGSFSGTITSGHGEYGKAADDYYMKLISPSTANEAARIYLPLEHLDAPVNNIVAKAKIAFTTTNETRYIFSYRTSKSPYEGFFFYNNGTIGYQNAQGRSVFKDADGKELTYEAGHWYDVAVKFDFQQKTISYYLDNTLLLTTTPGDINSFHSTTEVSIKGVVNKNNPGTILIDDLFIGQEQESYVTSVLSSSCAKTILTGESLHLTGYAKDAAGNGVKSIELLDNNEKIKEVSSSQYDIILTDLSPGHHTIIAKATSGSGELGYSQAVELVVSGISLPSMYADSMLLQRNKDIRIAGKGNNGTQVTVSLNGIDRQAAVHDGAWEVTFPPQPANKGTDLTFSVSDGVTISYKNVAVGELILCAGQSNMAYTLEKFSSLMPEADKDYPDIRLFKQSEKTSNAVKDDIPSGYWEPATMAAASSFPGVGFAAGKKYYISQNGEVPVGLICAAVGGSNLNAWVASDAFDHDPDLIGMKAANNQTYYNTVIAPWQNYTLGHVIWYQGEANTMLMYNYEKALTVYIDTYRKAWNDPSLSFIIVQLPVYDYPNKYPSGDRTAIGVREAQFNVSQRLENVASVVTIDTGEINNIHPNDKQAVAQRCALALCHFTQPEDTSLVWKSPSYDNFTLNSGQMVISFKDVAGGLKTADGEAPRGFKIAGDDNVFTDAHATLSDNTIIVDTSGVTGAPKVRYAFEDVIRTDDGTAIVPNLVNSAGLPLAPFRTDQDRYHKKFENGSFTVPYNYVPMIRSITAGEPSANTVPIIINARDYDDSIVSLSLYEGNTLLGEASRTAEEEFTFLWENPPAGTHMLHAIAIDSAGASSVKQDSSLGIRTVSPQTYTIQIAASGSSILHFKDLSGNTITNFEGKDGVSVYSDQEGSAKLILACYTADKTLLCVKLTDGPDISFTAEELKNAGFVSAFLFKDAVSLQPLTHSLTIPK